MNLAFERLFAGSPRRLIGFAALALLAAACDQQPPSSWPGLTSEGDTLYVAYNQQVHALDVATGQLQWSFPVERDSRLTFYAEPEVADNVLVEGGFDSSVYGLNAETGVPVWPQPFTEPTDAIVGAAVVGNGIAYVPSADYHLYALDTETGAKRWSFRARQAIWAQPVIDGNRLYVASLDHYLYALDAGDGSLIWERQLGGAIAGTPALVDGKLVVGAFDNQLYAVDVANGAIDWTQPTEGWVWSGPLEADGILYYGDVDGYLYAADAASGEAQWKVLVRSGGAIRGTPALDGDTLYVASRDGFLYFRSKDNGAPVDPGEVELTGQLLVSPLIIGDTLIVAAYGAQENKLVFALNAATGAELWSFVAP